MKDVRVLEQELYAAMRRFQRYAPDGPNSPQLQDACEAVFLAERALRSALLQPEARRAA